MTAFRTAVLEHFRHPRNRGPVDNATVSIDGANPLCGDRIRIQLRIERDAIAAAGFTADACALCTAAASVLTEHVRGMTTGEATALDAAWINSALGGEPPHGREKCAQLPLDTLRRAVASSSGVHE
ncbi:MAG TPA: iron-sulfur cluster assembly scaffold protein [Gemmatimonadaceae bacterium]